MAAHGEAAWRVRESSDGRRILIVSKGGNTRMSWERHPPTHTHTHHTGASGVIPAHRSGLPPFPKQEGEWRHHTLRMRPTAHTQRRAFRPEGLPLPFVVMLLCSSNLRPLGDPEPRSKLPLHNPLFGGKRPREMGEGQKQTKRQALGRGDANLKQRWVVLS